MVVSYPLQSRGEEELLYIHISTSQHAQSHLWYMAELYSSSYFALLDWTQSIWRKLYLLTVQQPWHTQVPLLVLPKLLSKGRPLAVLKSLDIHMVHRRPEVSILPGLKIKAEAWTLFQMPVLAASSLSHISPQLFQQTCVVCTLPYRITSIFRFLASCKYLQLHLPLQRQGVSLALVHVGTSPIFFIPLCYLLVAEHT